MSSVRSNDSGYSIVLVDDDAAHRMLVRRALRTALPGSTIIEIPGFRAARQALFAEPAALASLLIIDLNLGDGYGAELVAEITKSSVFKHAQLLVVSTSFLEVDVTSSYSAGAHAFLVKNTDPRLFAEEIGSAAACLIGLAPRAPA